MELKPARGNRVNFERVNSATNGLVYKLSLGVEADSFEGLFSFIRISDHRYKKSGCWLKVFSTPDSLGFAKTDSKP